MCCCCSVRTAVACALAASARPGFAAATCRASRGEPERCASGRCRVQRRACLALQAVQLAHELQQLAYARQHCACQRVSCMLFRRHQAVHPQPPAHTPLPARIRMQQNLLTHANTMHANHAQASRHCAPCGAAAAHALAADGRQEPAKRGAIRHLRTVRAQPQHRAF